MKPNVVTAVTARLAASPGRALTGICGIGTAAAIAFAGPALAGDRAVIDFIGYSADSRYFAFEEFGIQDGSGFPYSSIYIIDLA